MPGTSSVLKQQPLYSSQVFTIPASLASPLACQGYPPFTPPLPLCRAAGDRWAISTISIYTSSCPGGQSARPALKNTLREANSWFGSPRAIHWLPTGSVRVCAITYPPMTTIDYYRNVKGNHVMISCQSHEKAIMVYQGLNHKYLICGPPNNGTAAFSRRGILHSLFTGERWPNIHSYSLL